MEVLLVVVTETTVHGDYCTWEKEIERERMFYMTRLKFGGREWGDDPFRMKKRQSHMCTGERGRDRGDGRVLCILMYDLFLQALQP